MGHIHITHGLSKIPAGLWTESGPDPHLASHSARLPLSPISLKLPTFIHNLPGAYVSTVDDKHALRCAAASPDGPKRNLCDVQLQLKPQTRPGHQEQRLGETNTLHGHLWRERGRRRREEGGRRRREEEGGGSEEGGGGRRREEGVRKEEE